MAPVKFYTNDLAHWPQVRHLEQEFLANVDRFYLQGFSLLLWTYDDRVHQSKFEVDKWSTLIEVIELSGKRVVSVASGEHNMAALNTKGDLFLWSQGWINPGRNGLRPRKVLSNISMIHGEGYHESLFAVAIEGTVWTLEQPEPYRVKALSQHGPVVSIACAPNRWMVITAAGLCIVAQSQNALSANSFEDMRVTVLRHQPPSQPFSVVWFNGWNVLTLDGQIFKYDFLSCWCCNKPHHLPLSERVSAMVGHGRSTNEQLVVVTHSGRLIQHSTGWAVSSLTSVADLMATMSGLTHFTPNLVTITAQARAVAGAFNNPLTADRQLGWISFRLRWKPFYLTSSVLAHLFPRETNLASLRLTEVSFQKRYQTLFGVLHYLHSGDLRQLELLHLRLYVLAVELKNSTLEAIAVGFTVHHLTYLYRHQPVHLKECLEMTLKQLGQPQTVHNVAFLRSSFMNRTKPDDTLGARVLRHLVKHSLKQRFEFLRNFGVDHLFQA